MRDWRHVRTERLWLDEPADGDADALFAIHSDPASWRHFPSGRVTDGRAGATMVWRGPDEGNPDPGAVRLVYLDREPDEALVTAMDAAAMPPSGLVG